LVTKRDDRSDNEGLYNNMKNLYFFARSWQPQIDSLRTSNFLFRYCLTT
jgi:hypothetical protein